VTRPRTPLPAVSLFTNCGAGDVGFADAGFDFQVMAELDERRLAVALLNHPNATGVPGDLRVTLDTVIDEYRRRMPQTAPALLAACPPCQGMSSAQSARGMHTDADVGSRDPRNLLVSVIADAARELQPRIIVIENVYAFLTRRVRHPRTGDPVSAAALIITELASEYLVFPLIADLADFGVPQSRKRAFLTFIRRTESSLALLERRSCAPYPWPSHASATAPPVTLREALAEFRLPVLDAAAPASAASEVPLHFVPVLDQARYEMISAIPPDSGSSAWQNDRCLRCGRRTRQPNRHRCSGCRARLPRPIWKAGGTERLIAGFKTSYARMDPDQPAATITTASGNLGSDRTLHPWESRVMSPLECALLQTFPRSFNWGDALARWGHSNVRAMIGEAVPPLFTRKHGRVLAQLLRGTGQCVAIAADDARILRAQQALTQTPRRQSSRVTKRGGELVKQSLERAAPLA
jgi:DNA (cytosine-5)-methyltransferase 1